MSDDIDEIVHLIGCQAMNTTFDELEELENVAKAKLIALITAARMDELRNIKREARKGFHDELDYVYLIDADWWKDRYNTLKATLNNDKGEQ